MGTRNLICVVYKGKFVIAQYCQWDGYPEGQGAALLYFLSFPSNIERLKKGLEHIYLIEKGELEKIQEEVEKLENLKMKVLYSPENAERLKKGEHVGRVEKDESEKTQAEVDRLEDWKKRLVEGLSDETGTLRYGLHKNNALKVYWPSLSRDLGSGILETVASASADNKVPIQLSLEFALDTMFCEWVYVVALDEERFEVFGGNMGKEWSGSTRFNDIKPAESPDLVRRLLMRMGAGRVPYLIKTFDFKNLPRSNTLVKDIYNTMKARDEADEKRDEEEEERVRKEKEEREADGNKGDSTTATEPTETSTEDTTEAAAVEGDKSGGEVDVPENKVAKDVSTTGADTQTSTTAATVAQNEAVAEGDESTKKGKAKHDASDDFGKGMPAVHSLRIGSLCAESDMVFRF